MTMDLNAPQLREIYSDNMKKANALCKELAAMTGNPTWHKVADGLLGMRLKGLQIANAKSLSKTDINKGLDNYKASFVSG